MKHDEHVTMCSLEWLEHERRKAWQEGYSARWKDPGMRFSAIYKRKPIQGDRQMKHNPFEIAFGIVLTVCLCVAPIIIFTIS